VKQKKKRKSQHTFGGLSVAQLPSTHAWFNLSFQTEKHQNELNKNKQTNKKRKKKR